MFTLRHVLRLDEAGPKVLEATSEEATSEEAARPRDSGASTTATKRLPTNKSQTFLALTHLTVAQGAQSPPSNVLLLGPFEHRRTFKLPICERSTTPTSTSCAVKRASAGHWRRRRTRQSSIQGRTVDMIGWLPSWVSIRVPWSRWRHSCFYRL